MLRNLWRCEDHPPYPLHVQPFLIHCAFTGEIPPSRHVCRQGAEESTFIGFLGSSASFRWNTTGITVLSSPILTLTSGLYFDINDTLYIVDEQADHVILKLPKNSSTATRVAGLLQTPGSNATQLSNPQDVYIDSNRNLYVSDCNNHRVQKYINGSFNAVTIAGITASGGSALNQLTNPRYFIFDPTETYFYLADTGNSRIMRYATNSTTGTNGTVVAGGNGSGNTNSQLNAPWGIYYLPTVSNYLYITNVGGHTVMRWAPGASSGTVIAGVPGVSGSNSTMLNSPMGIKLDMYLNMFVVDSVNNRVQMFCQNSLVGITIAGDGSLGSNATQMNGPRSIAFDSQMNMYIGDLWNSRVQKFLKL